MNDAERDDLDRLLAGDDMVIPSARFAADVMAAVERAANEPPLPFPWGRFAIGVAGCLGDGLGLHFGHSRVLQPSCIGKRVERHGASKSGNSGANVQR